MKKGFSSSLFLLVSLGAFCLTSSAVAQETQSDASAPVAKVEIGSYSGGGAASDLGLTSTNTVVGAQINSMADIYNKSAADYDQMHELFTTKMQAIEQDKQQYIQTVSAMMNSLRRGTMPANPDLLNKATTARTLLAGMTTNLSAIIRVASATDKDTSLMEYGVRVLAVVSDVSGGVEEDHKNATKLRGAMGQMGVKIGTMRQSVRTSVKDTSNFIAVAQRELGKMNIWILDGKISDDSKGSSVLESAASGSAGGASAGASLSGAALVIPFANPNVNFRSRLQAAIGPKLKANPQAKVYLVAVYPPSQQGRQLAQQGTMKVGKAIVSMGLSSSRLAKPTGKVGPKGSKPAVGVFVR